MSALRLLPGTPNTSPRGSGMVMGCGRLGDPDGRSLPQNTSAHGDGQMKETS